MKKILLVNQTSCGGAERMTLLYGKILESHGYDLSILINKVAKYHSFNLMPFIPTSWQFFINDCSFRWMGFFTWRVIQKVQPDVVFCSMALYSKLVLILKKLGMCRAKVVIRCNNMPSKFSKSEHKAASKLYKYADGIIAQTQEMKDEMIKYYKLSEDKIVVINNPIDKELIHQKIQETFEFDNNFVNYVAVGRVAKQKDFATMLRAFAIVLKKQPQSRLYIVGKYNDDEVKAELDCIIRDNAMKDNIFFEGFQSNPFKYMNGCDAFCLSSEYEGLPNVMLEAMYLGKPVAVTKSIPFIAQTIVDGENGYSCETHDSESFADCMVKVLSVKIDTKYNACTNSEFAVVDFFNSL